jgi:hypothetical protein
MSESAFGNDVVQVASIAEPVVTFEPNGWRASPLFPVAVGSTA